MIREEHRDNLLKRQDQSRISVGQSTGLVVPQAPRNRRLEAATPKLPLFLPGFRRTPPGRGTPHPTVVGYLNLDNSTVSK